MSKSIFNIFIYTSLVTVTIGLSLFYSSCNRSAIPMKGVDTGSYLKKVFQTSNGDLNYRIYYPENFDPSKRHPLLLFMHGAGERGDDNEAQLVHGSELIANGMNKYNAIAVFPQCPSDDYWVKFEDDNNEDVGIRSFNVDVENGPTEALGKVIGLVSKLKLSKQIDTDKIYVVGLSMGGMATFDLLWRMPNTFAAAMPICGAGSPEKANFMKSIPMRIFHGEDDAVVPITKSMLMEKAIKAERGNIETFYYPDVNHDSWNNAFGEKDFLSWMFAQKLLSE